MTTSKSNYHQLAALHNWKEDKAPPMQVSDISKNTILKYKYHADKEKNDYLRLSNYAVSILLQIDSTSWRMFNSIVSELDIYPSELIEDESFLMDFSLGKATIPEKFRTVTVRAKTYEQQWKLSKQNSYRTFTLDAIKLFDETLSRTTFDPSTGEGTIGISRPISDITFHVNEKTEDGKDRIQHISRDLIKLDNQNHLENTYWQSHAITFVIHERLAYQSLFLQKMFTILDKETLIKLTKPSMKIYSLFCMWSSRFPKMNDGWLIEWDLDQCNAMAGTRSTSIANFAKNFQRYADEINKKTRFSVYFDKDETTKVKQKYTRLRIYLTTNEASILSIKSEEEVTPTRKLVPRPRVLKGSAQEGEWARRNIAILLKYEQKLKQVKRVLPKDDRDRLKRYYVIIGQKYS